MKEKLIIPLKDLQIPKKLSKNEINNERNNLFDMMANIIKEQREMFAKYREFLGKCQELGRQKKEIEDKMVGLCKQIRIIDNGKN